MPDPKKKEEEKPKRPRGAWAGFFIPTNSDEDGEELLNDDEGRLLVEIEDSKGSTELHILGKKKPPDAEPDGE